MTQGFQDHPGALSRAEQEQLARDVFAAAELAPFFRPVTPGGKPMSVSMTGLGPLSWVADRAGYRYESLHPHTGRPWPPMPPILLDLWRRHAPGAPAPDACLANLYRGGAKMGLHQDRDERDFSVPVLSVSAAMSVMGWFSGLPPIEPWNGAPKAKMPPSDATSQ